MAVTSAFFYRRFTDPPGTGTGGRGPAFFDEAEDGSVLTFLIDSIISLPPVQQEIKDNILEGRASSVDLLLPAPRVESPRFVKSAIGTDLNLRLFIEIP